MSILRGEFGADMDEPSPTRRVWLSTTSEPTNNGFRLWARQWLADRKGLFGPINAGGLLVDKF
jgi:hypothetical protein